MCWSLTVSVFKIFFYETFIVIGRKHVWGGWAFLWLFVRSFGRRGPFMFTPLWWSFSFRRFGWRCRLPWAWPTSASINWGKWGRFNFFLNFFCKVGDDIFFLFLTLCEGTKGWNILVPSVLGPFSVKSSPGVPHCLIIIFFIKDGPQNVGHFNLRRFNLGGGCTWGWGLRPRPGFIYCENFWLGWRIERIPWGNCELICKSVDGIHIFYCLLPLAVLADRCGRFAFTSGRSRSGLDLFLPIVGVVVRVLISLLLWLLGPVSI